MIDKNIVKNLVEQWLEGKDYFLVGIEINSDNKIVVEIGVIFYNGLMVTAPIVSCCAVASMMPKSSAGSI